MLPAFLRPRFRSDADFALASLAVRRGLLTREQIEECLDGENFTGALLKREFVNPQQLDELRAAARPVPDEVLRASENPENEIGRYVRVRLLGHGGMGDVFLAWDTELGRWVALKFMKASEDATDRARFLREARLASALSHPNIASVYAVENHFGSPFIAMQYVDGVTLDRAAQDLPLPKLAKIVADAARALQYAHGQAVLHRDLKPGNLMLDRSGRVFVMDFGLAKQTTVDRSLSVSGEALGTPAYIPPEQAEGRRRDVDARSDVYGLGATLYRLVTGREPFSGETVYDVLMKAVREAPVPPRRLDPKISADLETVILKAMEKEPGRRYATAEQFAEDLERWIAGEPILARPPSTFYRLRVRIRKEKKLAAALGALLLLVSAGAVIVPRLLRNVSETERTDSAHRKIEEARRLYEAGSFAKVADLAREAQVLAPELPGGWYWEARCAIREYSQYLTFPTPWVSDGIVEFLPPPPEPAAARGLREKAVKLVDRMRDLVREGLEGWETDGALGIVAVLQGRHEEGKESLYRSLKDERARWDLEAKFYLALTLYYLRRFEEAAADKAVLQTPQGNEFLFLALQGAALQDALAGRSARALERFEQAKAVTVLFPDPVRGKLLQSAILVSRAELVVRIGRGKEALADLERAQTLADEAAKSSGAAAEACYRRGEARMALAHLHERRGKRSEAVAAAREAIGDYGESLRHDSGNLAAVFRRGLAHEYLHHNLRNPEAEEERQAAAEDIEQVAKTLPGPNVRMALFRLAGPSEHQERQEVLDRLLADHPGFLPAYLKRSEENNNFAQELWENRKEDPTPAYEAAERDCLAALKCNSEYAEAHLLLSRLHAAWGDYLLIHRQDPTEKYHQTYRDCDQALKCNPELYEAYCERAGKRISHGVHEANRGGDPEPHWALAIDDHTKALAVNPEYVASYVNRALARMNLAMVYDARDRDPIPLYELALRDCALADQHEAGDRRPIRERGFIHINKGYAHAGIGEEEQARRHLEEGVKELTACIPPDANDDVYYIECFLARGQALCSLGRHREARQDYEAAIARGRRSAQPLLEACRNHGE